MKKILCLLLCFAAITSSAQSLNSLISRGPDKAEIAAGIKEALEGGITAGTGRLSAEGGFLMNPSVKILFPPEALKAESTLRRLGMNKLCDDFILSLNRAAEMAAMEAKPIFIKAIKDMSLADATSLLVSKEADAATKYFKQQTSSPLQERFKPIIQSSLDRAGATKHWTDIVSSYNKVPLVKKMNTDLPAYATEKAIDGLFLEIAREELRIRQNAAARTSPLLQKVFGFAEKSR